METMNTLGTIRTASGRLVQPAAVAPGEIDITDLAHALSQQCRFGGHTDRFYSVAQHSVAVSRLAAGVEPTAGLWGLLHDASEAYLVDLPQPLKVLPAFAGYRAIEADVQARIYARFGLTGAVPDVVHWADEQQLAIEFRDLMPARAGDAWAAEAAGAAPLKPMRPRTAKAAFLQRFLELVSIGGLA